MEWASSQCCNSESLMERTTNGGKLWNLNSAPPRPNTFEMDQVSFPSELFRLRHKIYKRKIKNKNRDIVVVQTSVVLLECTFRASITKDRSQDVTLWNLRWSSQGIDGVHCLGHRRLHHRGIVVFPEDSMRLLYCRAPPSCLGTMWRTWSADDNKCKAARSVFRKLVLRFVYSWVSNNQNKYFSRDSLSAPNICIP